MRIRPVLGAKIFITYKKERDEGSGGGGAEVEVPIRFPIFSPTPTATASPTALQSSFFHTMPLLISSSGADLAGNASIAFHSSGVNFSLAAATFSSKCARDDVPGIGSITGERSRSQASAT